MVSVRRRKLIGLVNGGQQGDQLGLVTGKVSPTPSPTGPGACVPEKCSPKDEQRNKHPLPLVMNDRSLAVEEGDKPIPKSPAKKLKIHIQVDPENPMEVHTYLMKLKEDNKLDLGPIVAKEKLSIKELMDIYFPHIFRVFPQDSKVFVQLSEKSRQLDLLYSHYCLFLLAVRNVASMDHKVSPDFVKSLGDAIVSLEIIGFDCRFIRSELLVASILIKQQLNLVLARKNVIAARASNFERDLQAATMQNAKLLEPFDKLPRADQNIELCSPCIASIEEEYFETVLKQHKELLAITVAEAERLSQVSEKISLVLRDKSAVLTL